MKCTFTVGQKVVCIYPGPWFYMQWNGYGWDKEPARSVPPSMNAVYTITKIEVTNGDVVTVFLKEHNPDQSYVAECFRPLQDRPKEAQTDISVFTPLLNARETETQDETPVAVP